MNPKDVLVGLFSCLEYPKILSPIFRIVVVAKSTFGILIIEKEKTSVDIIMSNDILHRGF